MLLNCMSSSKKRISSWRLLHATSTTTTILLLLLLLFQVAQATDKKNNDNNNIENTTTNNDDCQICSSLTGDDNNNSNNEDNDIDGTTSATRISKPPTTAPPIITRMTNPDRIFMTSLDTCQEAQDYMSYHSSFGDPYGMCTLYKNNVMLDMASYCGCTTTTTSSTTNDEESATATVVAQPPNMCPLCTAATIAIENINNNTPMKLKDSNLEILGTDGLTCGTVDDILQYVTNDALCDEMRIVADFCCEIDIDATTTPPSSNTIHDVTLDREEEDDESSSLTIVEEEETASTTPTTTIADATTNEEGDDKSTAETSSSTQEPQPLNKCNFCIHGGKVTNEYKPLIGTDRTCGELENLIGSIKFSTLNGVTNHCNDIVQSYGGNFEFDPMIYCDCPNTSTSSGPCQFCPVGQTLVNPTKIISNEEQGEEEQQLDNDTDSDNTLTVSNAPSATPSSTITCSHYADLAKAAHDGEGSFCTAIQAIGIANECCGPSCTLCQDGSFLQAIQRSKLFVGGQLTCGDYEDAISSIPLASDQCQSNTLLNEMEMLFNVQQYCECPAEPNDNTSTTIQSSTTSCPLCSHDNEIVLDPNKYIEDISLSCGHLEDVAHATVSVSFCDSLQSIGNYFCCGDTATTTNDSDNNNDDGGRQRQLLRHQKTDHKSKKQQPRSLLEQLKVIKAVHAVNHVAVTVQITPQRPPVA